MLASDQANSRAVIAALKWSAGFTIVFFVTQVVWASGVGFLEGKPPIFFALIVAANVFFSMFAAAFAASVVGLVVGTYYLVVRNRPRARFWGSETPWTQVALRSTIVGVVIGVVAAWDYLKHAVR
jgi:hypothetical protein